jgi:hypothetical protein
MTQDSPSIVLLFFISIRRVYISELRSPTGLFFIPQVMHAYGEWWNDSDRGTPKSSGGSLFQWHFAHHKSHQDSDANPGLRSETSVANRLGHGTALQKGVVFLQARLNKSNFVIHRHTYRAQFFVTMTLLFVILPYELFYFSQIYLRLFIFI